MDEPDLRGLLRRLRIEGQGTRVSCTRELWARLAGTHRRLDESSMPDQGHGARPRTPATTKYVVPGFAVNSRLPNFPTR